MNTSCLPAISYSTTAELSGRSSKDNEQAAPGAKAFLMRWEALHEKPLG